MPKRTKPIRWSQHALQNLADREIDRTEAETTIGEPDSVEPGRASRQVFMRQYSDPVLHQEMLLRVVLEETADALVVITAYKTSRIEKYRKGDRS